MDTYSAVVTTGIYCRPDCAARPKPENVRHYRSTAAAEADGFRACLRCRPYRSSDLAVGGASELVCRATRLVLDGALDRGSEPELAARLGVSARHLRRLFVDEVGVTPDGLARSRRAHFARRLLDDTDLTVTEIAFAAGFGSVRQFNRVCREVFRAPPGELRARRHAADRLAADGGLVLRLPYDEPFDLDALLGYLAVRAVPGVETVVERTYRRTVVIDGHPGVLELTGGEEPGELRLRAHLPRWEGLIHVVDRVRRLAGLDTDPVEVADHLADDSVAGPLVAEAPGVRPPGAWDGFEIGIRAILGQQVTVRGATTLAGRLVERHGIHVPGLEPLGLTHTFPTAELLATAELTDLGMPSARATAIRGFASAVADGTLRLDRSRSLEEFVDEIGAIRGLGPWTAHYLALRLGERDAFPVTDLGLRRALGGATPLSSAALEELAEPWRPLRASVAARLWMRDATDDRRVA